MANKRKSLLKELKITGRAIKRVPEIKRVRKRLKKFKLKVKKFRIDPPTIKTKRKKGRRVEPFSDLLNTIGRL